MAKYGTYGDDCERLFVRDGKTHAEIKDITGVSVVTQNRWRKKYKWDAKRKIYLSTPRATIDMLERILTKKLEQIEAMDVSEINQTVADGLVKLMAAVRRAKKEEHIRNLAVSVFARFAPFVKKKEKDADKIEWLAKMMHAFFEDIRYEG